MLRRYAPVGALPGTLMLDQDCEHCSINLISYSASSFEERRFERTEFDSPLDSPEHPFRIISDKYNLCTSNVEKKNGDGIVWVDVYGLGDANSLRSIAALFNLHELTTSDIANVPQRPKIEDQDGYLLFISTMLYLQPEYVLEREQLSIVCGKNFVLTFQEKDGDVIEPVRKRLRLGQGSIRKMGSDYLSYALLDTVIDSYYPILEEVGEFLEEIEENLVNHPTHQTLQNIFSVKRQLLMIRRSIWPHREMLNSILRGQFPMIRKSTLVYFRDTYDHTVELIDVIETGRELAGSYTDLYLSSISNRMNDVMKVLTMISTVFIPLSFIAGIYGMNFEHMPELKYSWSYPVLLVFMFVTAIGMLFFFWKKGWIGNRFRES
ncbi:MAG TPA: magnesium/cobalt transporter CorA [Oligoflexia bacterium]|nr:magnesium/cobalt transporter CorA [Oligoflexia bacterium]HMP47444.1 magnesium/cobalt transporter CorA [Oligoflexia bacterium]